MSFGERLKTVRNSLELNQDQFGKKLGLSTPHISKLERNAVPPTEIFIKAVCLMWGINEEWLRHGTGNMKNPFREIEKHLDGEDALRKELRRASVKATQAIRLENVFLPGFFSLAWVEELLTSPDAENIRYLLNAILVEWQARDAKERLRLEIRLEDCIPDYEKLKKQLRAEFEQRKTRNDQRLEDTSSHVYENTPQFSIPVVGRAAAGMPIEMIESHGDSLGINGDAKARPGDFAVIASGDSMTGVGIHDGDHVIIRPHPTVENGQIALVAIGDGSTIKRFYRDENGIRLVPANDDCETQYYSTDDDIRVLGKYVCSVHI